MPRTERRPHAGRPRLPETIERDQVILRELETNGPRSRNELSEALGIKRSLIYLALRRLRGEKRVRICAPPDGGDMLWSAGGEGPCP